MFYKNKSYTKTILLLAIPVALQNLISAILNIFDQLMVGWLPAGVADNSLSAVLLANQVVFIFTIVLFATSNTANIYIAQYSAVGKEKLIPSRVALALTVNIAAGVVGTLLCTLFPSAVIGLFNPQDGYRVLAEQFLSVVAFSFIPMAVTLTVSFVLRAIKRMKVPLFCSVIAVGANIFFNYALMFGKFGFTEYGFIGAAYGTIISRVLEMVLLIVCLIWRKYPIVASPKVMFSWDRPFVKGFFRMFFPILVNEVSWAVSTAVFMFVYDKLPSSEVVLAAVNITSSVDKLVSVIMIGVGSSTCIVLGNTIAKGDIAETRRTVGYSLQFGLLTGIVVAALTVACAFFAPQFFTNASLDAQNAAKILLLLYGATAIFRSMAYTLIVGILRSGGDTTYCMVAESIIIWAVAVPLVCVGGLVFQLNVYILFTLTMFSEALKCLATYLRLKGNKWLKVLV
jgi:putative MATE family efflux protein